jgi:hypothetical protein
MIDPSAPKHAERLLTVPEDLGGTVVGMPNADSARRSSGRERLESTIMPFVNDHATPEHNSLGAVERNGLQDRRTKVE